MTKKAFYGLIATTVFIALFLKPLEAQLNCSGGLIGCITGQAIYPATVNAGTNPATSGVLNLPYGNQGTISFRNSSNTGDIAAMGVSGTTILIAPSGNPVEYQANVTIAGGAQNFQGNSNTYTGSITGTAVWSMPFQGATKKEFDLCYEALHDAGGTITFPTAFTQTPFITGASSATAISTASTTTFTIAVAATISGCVKVDGF